MNAKYHGTCKNCGYHIHPGTPIRMTPSGAVHTACAIPTATPHDPYNSDDGYDAHKDAWLVGEGTGTPPEWLARRRGWGKYRY